MENFRKIVSCRAPRAFGLGLYQAVLKFHLLTGRLGPEEAEDEGTNNYSNWFARGLLLCSLNKKPLNAQTQNIVKQLKGSTKVLWSRERDLEQARIAQKDRVKDSRKDT